MNSRFGKLLMVAFAVPLCGAHGCEQTPQQLILQHLGVTKAVIFNADDLGMQGAVNQGIAESWRGAGGIVTSTSLQTTSDEASLQAALDWITKSPNLDVGVHLTLVTGDGARMGPVLDPTLVPSLVDGDGLFFRSYWELFSQMALDEVEMELRAQIEIALDHGVDVSHLDAHLGTCDAIHPGLQEIYLDLAEEYDVPARWWTLIVDQRPTDHGVVVPNYAWGLTDISLAAPGDLQTKRQRFLDRLRALPDGITEIVVHPSVDAVPNNRWREVEYWLLTDPEVVAEIDKMVSSGELAVIGYEALRQVQRLLRVRGADAPALPL